MSIAYEAMIFAMEAHKGQKRKYTGNPYTDHLAQVAGIVATVLDDDYIIAIAWLHDCVKDCGITESQLYERFDCDIAKAVIELSDLEIGNRKERKKLSRERLSKCNGYVQTIKVADLISNTSSIVEHDHDFAKVYLEEKRLLLDVLTKADKKLVQLARDIIK
jgi:GTP diphosphokinase / guanosine-3',5'-bis(diphosphate) 3'-diphosphatase